MLSIRVDVEAALASLKEIRADQIPFAVSRSINSAAYESREALLQNVFAKYKFKSNTAWVRGSRTGRNGWFFVEPSNKRALTAIVSTNAQYTYQYLYREGSTPGLKVARKRYLAVPLGNLQQRLIPPDLRPKAVMDSGFGFIVGKGTEKFIAVRNTKKGFGLLATGPRYKGLQLLYILVPLVRIRGQKITDMETIVRATVARVFPEALKVEMANAIRTAR
jgi:hypothetical protein